jgi:hypothetical protein
LSRRCIHFVIASEANQSIAPLAEKWIASSLSLLAMTVVLDGSLLSIKRMARLDRTALYPDSSSGSCAA